MQWEQKSDQQSIPDNHLQSELDFSENLIPAFFNAPGRVRSKSQQGETHQTIAQTKAE
jgi:hypothetical protein